MTPRENEVLQKAIQTLRTEVNPLQDRNLTSHVYEQSEAGDIYRRIKGSYVSGIESIAVQIQKKVLS